MKILHIGLGKTGSGFLQTFIYPIICKSCKIPYYKNNFFTKNFPDVEKSFFEKQINYENKLGKKFFISSENLFSLYQNFDDIEINFEYLKKNFQNDVKIIIFLRRPSDYLTSLYVQYSIHQFECIDIKDFFINKKNYRILDKSKSFHKYNLYYFNYKKLINLYKSYFKNVIIIKYEDLFENLTFITCKKFIKKILANKYNKSIDQKLKKIDFNKKVNKSIDEKYFSKILLLNKFFNLKKVDNFFLKMSQKNILFKYFRPRYFFQSFIIKFKKNSNSRYSIKFSKKIKNKIIKLDREYIEIR